MIVNQTGHHRRVLRTDIDSSIMKKPKKLIQRRKLRHTDSKPMKKERKKRMKKLPEQEIIVTQTIESQIDSRTLISLKTIDEFLHF